MDYDGPVEADGDRMTPKKVKARHLMEGDVFTARLPDPLVGSATFVWLNKRPHIAITPDMVEAGLQFLADAAFPTLTVRAEQPDFVRDFLEFAINRGRLTDR